jgi:photosystem II stability/assembly factor-like uncharacterized protein
MWRFLFVYLLFPLPFAQAETFLIKSTDGGQTWVDIDPGPPDAFLAWFHVDPGRSTVYALTQASPRGFGPEQHLLASDDGGQSWDTRQTFPHNDSFWFSLAATPTSPDTLYLANQIWAPYYSGRVLVVRVADDGRETEQHEADGLSIMPEQLPSSTVAALTGFAADASLPSNLYALSTDDYSDDLYAYFQGLWASTDAGRSWRQLQAPVRSHCIYPLMWVGPVDSSLYLACGVGDTAEFWRSTDRGDSWAQRTLPSGNRIWKLTLAPGAPAILYTVDNGGAIWMSSDGAGSWQLSGHVPTTIAPLYMMILSVSPRDPSVLFGGGPKGIWKSGDGGGNWTQLLASSGDSDSGWSIYFDPVAPDTLYAASHTRQQVN